MLANDDNDDIGEHDFHPLASPPLSKTNQGDYFDGEEEEEKGAGSEGTEEDIQGDGIDEIQPGEDLIAEGIEGGLSLSSSFPAFFKTTKIHNQSQKDSSFWVLIKGLNPPEDESMLETWKDEVEAEIRKECAGVQLPHGGFAVQESGVHLFVPIQKEMKAQKSRKQKTRENNLKIKPKKMAREKSS